MGEVIELAACIGWDWSDKEHQICLREPGRRAVQTRQLKARPEEIHEWAAEMRRRYGGRPVGVCIEMGRGAVISALMNYDHIMLYPVNPKSVSNFREALYPSGKKDDKTDADIQSEFLEKHQERLRVFTPADEQTRLLAMLTEHRKTMRKELDRELNRLRSNLKRYYPQALELTGELDTPMAMELLQQWPSLESLKRSRLQTLESFYRKHGSRSEQLIKARLEVRGTATALTTDAAVIAAGITITKTLASVASTLIQELEQLDRQIEEIYKSHPEHDLIDSFYGAGPVMGPRLAAFMGTDRDRFEGAEDLQLLSGVAPITVQTGGPDGPRSVRRRIKRSKFLHQTVVEFAHHFAKSSEWARAYLEQQKSAGKSYWSAVRSLGFKLLRILYRCWKNRTMYDESHYQEELRRRGSPLARKLANA